MSYEYVVATETDREMVREALAEYFYPEEPLTLAHRDGSDVTMDDMETALSFLKKGTTILARLDGEIVGLAIGGLSEDVSSVPIITRKYADIVAFLECLSARASDAESFTSSYHVYILAVHPAHRGHSIGRRLMEKQIELVRARWPTVLTVTVEATSTTSLRLMKRIGMHETARLSFAEYRDDAGEQVFFGTGEATRLKLQMCEEAMSVSSVVG
ncbi:arylalkylamine N-acetyltransferase 1-like [Anopheles maculipalpis]|uniref:arylalkylamine N-acetyltransferase 1-like n=1 Tax=Anopheles maculipalpis TaxID=1496333 RepID=UPI002159B24F|nr:arylalkylamine N-acetyltransferase 1-like [Anopheles maculipalpis]